MDEVSGVRPGKGMDEESDHAILIGLGANLGGALGSRRATLTAALEALAGAGVAVRRLSRWYESAPVPASDQPWFINAVAAVATARDAADLLALLHRIEDRFGRQRRRRNEARVIDLDLLAYGRLVCDRPGGPVLPHPRLHLRAFVLLPLAEVAPAWRHPVSGRLVDDLIAALPAGQAAAPLQAGAPASGPRPRA